MPRMKALLPVTTTACPPMILGRRPKPCRSALAILNPTRTRFAIACRRHAYARGLAASLTALRSNITRMAGVFVHYRLRLIRRFRQASLAKAPHAVAPASSVSAGRNPFHASALFCPSQNKKPHRSGAIESFDPSAYSLIVVRCRTYITNVRLFLDYCQKIGIL